jgi:hypothetical protein
MSEVIFNNSIFDTTSVYLMIQTSLVEKNRIAFSKKNRFCILFALSLEILLLRLTILKDPTTEFVFDVSVKKGLFVMSFLVGVDWFHQIVILRERGRDRERERDRRKAEKRQIDQDGEIQRERDKNRQTDRERKRE